MCSVVQVNKDSIFHCCHDVIEIKGILICEKCPGGIFNKKKFKTCKSIYFHYVREHSGSDRNVPPSRDDCIERLQGVSNAIQIGLLK